MSWLPDDFFIGHPGPPDARPHRPIGQGDVFEGVPVAGRTAFNNNGQARAQVKVETVIVVASSCGMRKGDAGDLSPAIHVAPIKKLTSIAPGWGDPWDGRLNVLPLPDLLLGGEHPAADLSRIGLCGSGTVEIGKRQACVSLPGMKALKARLSGFFIRAEVPDTIVTVGAHEEWHELDLWERWTIATGSPDGFQPWLDDENPNYPGQRRRDTTYDDLAGIQQQLDEEVGGNI